jgi:Flp pilus assembly protein TadG
MNMDSRLLRGFQRGAAAVELALLTGLLLLPVTFIGVDAGRVYVEYDTLVKSVRDAARYLSENAPGDAASIAAAKCLAVHGTTDCTGPALATGLTTDQVTVCDRTSCPGTHNLQQTGRGVVNLVTVGIAGYQLEPWFGEPLPGGVANVVFGRDISVTMEQVL